jgi:hypothetical protein
VGQAHRLPDFGMATDAVALQFRFGHLTREALRSCATPRASDHLSAGIPSRRVPPVGNSNLFETHSLPALSRCHPRSFAFYVAHPTRSIRISIFGFRVSNFPLLG